MDIGVPCDFDENQADIYCRMIRHMTDNKAMFCHPAASIIPDEHWATIVANAAYFAAHCLDESGALFQIMDEEGIDTLSIESPLASQVLN